tara:strand:- start:2959 stop:3708 length:750 start_codon:yes stop_codon:yes gene_type:complete
MKKRIIARLDIKKDRLIKGVHLEGLRPIGNPIEYANKYYHQGIDELLLLDTVASLHGRNALSSFISELSKKIFIPITVGGGIKSIDTARELLYSGADKLTINSHALENPKLISQLADEFGSQAVVASLQIKKINSDYKLMTYNGRELSDKNLIDWLTEIQDLGAGEIMLTSIDQEGTCSGFDIKLLSKYRQFINTPLICSGGIANQMHTSNCFSKGADAVAIAAAFHFEKISINQIKESLIDNRVKIRL